MEKDDENKVRELLGLTSFIEIKGDSQDECFFFSLEKQCNLTSDELVLIQDRHLTLGNKERTLFMDKKVNYLIYEIRITIDRNIPSIRFWSMTRDANKNRDFLNFFLGSNPLMNRIKESWFPS